MEPYISKASLVAEIESLRKHYIERDDYDNGWNYALDKIISFLDTIEVKENKEVDWTEEIIKAHEENGWSYPNNFPLLEDVARHFYELGLQSQKGGES